MASDFRGVTGLTLTPVQDLPKERVPVRTDLKIAMINAAARIAAAKIEGLGDQYNTKFDFFKTEFERISQTIEQKGW